MENRTMKKNPEYIIAETVRVVQDNQDKYMDKKELIQNRG